MMKITDRINLLLVAFLILTITIGMLTYIRFEQSFSIFLVTGLYIIGFLILGSVLTIAIDFLTQKLNVGKTVNYLICVVFSLLLALLFIDSYLDMALIFIYCSTILWVSNQFFLKTDRES